MSQSRPTTQLGLGVLFVIAAGLTVAAFFSFIIPEYRNQTFYSCVVACCIAELVLFGYVGYTMGTRGRPDQPDLAIRMRLSVLVVLWTLCILVTSGIAVSAKYTDTFFSDKIILIQLILTFFLVGAVFFQHRQGVAVQSMNAGPQRERRKMESYGGGIDVLVAGIRAVAGREPEHAVEIDALLTRMATLKTQLQSVSALMAREEGRPVEPADAELVEECLGRVHDEVDALVAAEGDGVAGQLRKTREKVDRTLAVLRQREDAISF